MFKIANIPAPENFSKRVSGLHSAGWLDSIEKHILEFSEKWQLTGYQISENGVLSCCIFCKDKNNMDVVLKLPMTRDSGLLEIKALQVWKDSEVTPNIIFSDENTGIFVMEKLSGILGTAAHEESGINNFLKMWQKLEVREVSGITNLSINVSKRYCWAKDIHTRPSLSHRGSQLNLAHSISKRLLLNNSKEMIHGDLQTHNILQDGSKWFAIDPMAAFGESIFDIAMWITLQDSSISLSEMIEIVDKKVNIDVERLTLWCRVIAEFDLNPVRPEVSKRSIEFLDSF